MELHPYLVDVCYIDALPRCNRSFVEQPKLHASPSSSPEGREADAPLDDERAQSVSFGGSFASIAVSSRSHQPIALRMASSKS
jgi:hypothetical protein